MFEQPGSGVGGLFAGVGVWPVRGGDAGGGMRGVFEGVVHRVEFSFFNGKKFSVDGDERVAEAVEFFEGLTLGGLDHEGARNRPTHGRGMEAEVHEPFGHIFHFNTGTGFPFPQIDNALMGHPSVVSPIEDWEEWMQAMGDVVGIQDGQLGGAGEAIGTHHGQIHPGNDIEAGTAPGCLGDGAAGLFSAGGNDGVGGQEGEEMRRNADGAHAGAAAAVGDAECLVEIEVANIRSEVSRAAETDLGIHVCAVEIDLTTRFVDERADFADCGFEDAVGRGVGDHECPKFIAMVGDFFTQIVQIDIAQGVAADRNHCESRHDGTGWIGAMRGGGNEADAPVGLVEGEMVLADDEESGKFSLRACVGLERDSGKAGDFRKPALELGKNPLVALRLGDWCEGMQAGDGFPGEGEHFRRGVELHRAGAQGNHRSGEREIPALQTADVAQHLGLRMMVEENGVAETGRGAFDVGGPGIREGEIDGMEGKGIAVMEGSQERFEIGGRLIQRDADGMAVNDAEVEMEALRQALDVAGEGRAEADLQRVEVGAGSNLPAEFAQAGCEAAGLFMDACGDGAEAFGSMIDRIHRGHDGQENLCGADVAGGFFAADMLLAGLESEPEGGFAVGIAAHADEASWHAALERIFGGHERGVGSSVAEGHTEALGRTDDDVRAEFSGRSQEGESEKVAGENNRDPG